jgi:hypothetical protein
MPSVTTDLNEFNKLVGVAWSLADDEPVAISVMPLAVQPADRQIPAYATPVLRFSTKYYVCSYTSKGRVSGYSTATALSVPLGRLREICREMTAEAVSSAHQLGRFEKVEFRFKPRNTLEITCVGGGGPWLAGTCSGSSLDVHQP